MEKSQYELCIEVLRRLDGVGILKHVILVGSWCTLLYREYFPSRAYRPSLKTRDIDLLIPEPRTVRSEADVAALLKDLGFVVGFTGTQGFIRLEHPQLIVEFLVPEKGRPSNKPYPLPQLGLNAQALRFIEFLSQKTITLQIDEVTVTLPHPAYFALHKLLVLSRRPMSRKQIRDKESAMSVLTALIAKGEAEHISTAFEAMPKRWQSRIKRQLGGPLDREVLTVLEKKT